MRGKKRILLIDDEKDFCFFVKNNLEQTKKFKVDYATDPEKGLRRAKRRFPDLILLDILMPKKDGFKILEELKKNEKTISIPVIMLTALGEDETKIKAAAQYCEDYITKPVNQDLLKTKIDNVFDILKGKFNMKQKGVE